MVLPIEAPNCITHLVIANSLAFWNFRRLIFIINDASSCPRLLSIVNGTGHESRVVCIPRDNVIPGITMAFLARLNFNSKGWIFQQLVKFGVIFHVKDLSDLFLVWDSDMIPLRPFPLINNDGDFSPGGEGLASCKRHGTQRKHPRVTFFTGPLGTSHNPKAIAAYHGTYQLMTREKLVDPPGASWINGWQMWYKPYVKELLAKFTEIGSGQKKEKLKAEDWVRVILEAVVLRQQRDKVLQRNSFSEFDSYGGWVWTHHPGHVDLWHSSWRLWARNPPELSQNGLCCPSHQDLCLLLSRSASPSPSSPSVAYYYVVWENSKFPKCHQPQTLAVSRLPAWATSKNSTHSQTSAQKSQEEHFVT